MLLTAANANDGVGENGGEPEFSGTIDNLRGILSIDECFRNNKARTQGADSRLQGGGHSRTIPFAEMVGNRDAASQQHVPVNQNSGEATRCRIPWFLLFILATLTGFSKSFDVHIHRKGVRTP